MSQNRYNVSIGVVTSSTVPTTTLTAAIALALEGEAIKEVGAIDIERIDVEFDEVVE